MSRNQQLAELFERERPRLQRMAKRILGNWHHAEEAVQESWLKADKIPQEELRNAGAWFTTITTRTCMDRLRHRRRRAQTRTLEDPASQAEVANLVGDLGPEHAALNADSIGVALLVVLEKLAPLERVAFVLHDVFALSFEEIGPLIDRTPQAARQLASRARRRIRGPVRLDGGTIAEHRALADTFLDAARSSDMSALLRVLDPHVTLTSDERAAKMGAGTRLSGADQVARFLAGRASGAHVAMIRGDVGFIVAPADRLLLAVVMRFGNGRITHMHAIAAPDDLAQLELGVITPVPVAH